jgi:hypothetical protein
MPSGRVSSASRASRASGIGTSASTPAKLQRPARKSAARKSQDFIVISDDSDFELSASAEAESDAYSAFSAGSARSSGDEELPEDESAELSSAGEASPRLTLDSRSDSGDDEVATPSDVPSKRQKVRCSCVEAALCNAHSRRALQTEDGYFDTGSDPVVLLPTIASLKSKQASSSQSPLRRAMKQSTLSFGQRKPPQPAPAKAKAKAPAAKERRAATPDFIVDSSDEFISDGDEGAPRKRKQASGSKGAAAGKSKRWAPEFRAGRKVRYLPFVPKYEDAVAMAHAARAKEAAGELPPMSALDDIFGDIVRRLDTDAIVSLAKTLQVRPMAAPLIWHSSHLRRRAGHSASLPCAVAPSRRCWRSSSSAAQSRSSTASTLRSTTSSPARSSRTSRPTSSATSRRRFCSATCASWATIRHTRPTAPSSTCRVTSTFLLRARAASTTRASTT